MLLPCGKLLDMAAFKSQETPEFYARGVAPLYPENEQCEAGKPPANTAPGPSPELIALFRLLVREPPPDHDFGTCQICNRYDITGI
jgi:hypothetical protein